MPVVRIEKGMLRSRVARRVFTLFLGCALLPMVLFAFYSLSRVSEQLRGQADRQLHRSVKSTGMALVERLDLAVQDLELAGETASKQLSSTASAQWTEASDDDEGNSSANRKGPAGAMAVVLDSTLANRLASRFLDVELRAATGGRFVVTGKPVSGLELGPGEWAALSGGQSLVRTLSSPGSGSRVALILPRQESGEAVVGRVDPEYLWPSEGSASLETIRLCLDPGGEVLFTSGFDGEPPDLASLVDLGDNSGRFSWDREGDTWLGRYWNLFMRHQYDEEWIIFESAPQAEVLAPVREFRLVFGLICALSLAVVAFVSLMQIRKQLVPIEQLQEATRKIAHEQFGERVRIATGDEFEELGESFNAMATDLEHNLRMRRALIELGISLTSAGSGENLLPLLLQGVRSVLSCDGSGVVVLGSDGESDSFFSEFGGEIRTLDRQQVAECLPAARMEEPDALQSALGRSVHSTLALPLKDHEGDRIGTLYAMNARSSGSGELVEFSTETAQLAKLLAAQASAALTQNRLIESFRDLFNGLNQLIATAIDEKSPYTYGHCQRVPIATMILADAVSRSDDGPYADWSLTPEERYELEVAALLHDCGKVTTPVHVVDKATKLETIVDRIGLVEARFEIIARDRRIRVLESRLAAVGSSSEPGAGITRSELGTDEAPAPESGPDWDSQLGADLEFLCRCNQGGEFLPPEHKERIRTIASRYQFVDRTGAARAILTNDEIENLSISRGTLTDAERKVIQNHVVSSIKMLEMLPYPKDLARVPLIAGAHHEWMNGKGYPNGIQLGDLPLQARILALADVFEALTAKDRPYKDKKTLSEALRIMGFMKKDGQLDPELFDFFLTKGVYLEYAREYLEPEQIDEVDIASLPGCEGLATNRRAA